MCDSGLGLVFLFRDGKIEIGALVICSVNGILNANQGLVSGLALISQCSV